MQDFTDFVRGLIGETATGVSDGVIVAMGIVGGLLVLVSIFAMIVSICLAISYVKYNRKTNSCGYTGEQVARKLLDKNGLENIKVSKTGSILFGNSYSHYFKKVRLRRRTWQKDSVTSLTMAAQKSALAVLDKENDPDMRKRVKLTPIIYLGPIAFVPLIIIGALLDLFVYKSGNGTCVIVFSIIGLVFYLVSFIMSIYILKTEKKAQARALELMREDGLATPEELEMSKKLFKLYNIEYINDMVVALLELIYRALQIVSYVQHSN
ncbi:MAG: zinc metallopeptidase [Eubacteriales bacterium]|nr:zinc metallopeptidase [Eubacteriales bacterium]MDD3882916.1 zinc metallopeptidase [Eubacteriales bacterium]MDD4513906.1 zinc metallopeptidase [Eubacteriales bacterium]